MSKFASKLSKRIMATALSVAMVMSNMTVYASELTGPQVESSVDESVIDTEEPSVTPDDAATSGVETGTDATVAGDTTGNTVEDPADAVTGEDEQTPETGEDEVTEPEVNEVTEDASLESDEEVKSEESVPVKSYAIGARSTATSWSFTTENDWKDGEAPNEVTINNGDYIGENENGHYNGEWKGLIVTDVKNNQNKCAAMVASSKIRVPVEGKTECVLAVTYNYQATSVKVGNNKAHDDTTDTRHYICSVANDGYVDITFGGTTYIDKIEVLDNAIYTGLTEWNFTDAAFDATAASSGSYKSLTLSGVSASNDGAVIAANGTITVPVEESGSITITFEGTPNITIGEKTFTTGNEAVYTYTYDDVKTAKTITITANTETTVTSITKNVSEWNFAASDWTVESAKYLNYKGLIMSYVSREADQESSPKRFAIMKRVMKDTDNVLYSSKILVPVSAPSVVTVYGSNSANATIGLGTDTETNKTTLDATNMATGASYTYEGEGSAYVEIEANDAATTTYLTKIVVTQIPQTATLSGEIKFKDAEGNLLDATDDAAEIAAALSKLGTITFKSQKTGATAADNVAATKTNSGYTATLNKGESYKLEISNEDDYEDIEIAKADSNGVISVSANTADADITLTLKADTPPEAGALTVTVADYDDAYGARSGKISVTANAVIESAQTEKVTVNMYDALSNSVVDSKTSTTVANTHTFEFSPTYTSRYSFQAVLLKPELDEDGEIKKDDDDEVIWKEQAKSEKTSAITFTLPLGTPKIMDYLNLGKVEGADGSVSGSVELSWGAIDEATGYIVTAVELDEDGHAVTDEDGKPIEVFNSGTITSTTVTIRRNLEIGKTYTFEVAARRAFTGENGGLETTNKGTQNVTINEKADTFEEGKYILDAGLFERVDKPNAVEKAGKYSADQSVADKVPATKDDSNDDQIAAMNGTLDILKDETIFTDSNYFTLMYGSTGKVQKDEKKAYNNSYIGYNRIAIGAAITAGTVPTSDVVKFTTSKSSRVDVYWRISGGSNRALQILDAKGKQLGIKSVATTSEFKCDSFFLNDAGTYYLAGETGPICFARIVVYDGYVKQNRPEWTTDDEVENHVTAPVITDVALKDGDSSTVVAKVTADVGPEASADGVTVYMTCKNEDNTETEIAYQTSTADATEHELEFTPDSSGTYYFSAKMTREDQETTIDSVDKDGEDNDIRKKIDFKLPLGNVSIKGLTNKGKSDDSYGIVEAVWSTVKEAVYELEIKDSDNNTVYKKIETETIATIGKKAADETDSDWKDDYAGLELGKKYTFCVTAMREQSGAEGEKVTYEKTETAEMEIEITGKDSQSWTFANFGSGASVKKASADEADVKSNKHKAGIGGDSLTDTDPDSDTKGEKLADVGIAYNGYKILKSNQETDNPEKVRVWSVGGKGKIVPKSTDGVAVYYTSVDPSRYNFKLSADVHVDQWSLSNGQEGFGLLVFDRVTDTDKETSEGGEVWNNSYMAIASKTEYYWDDVKKKVSNVGAKVELKLGIESIVRTGVTADNLKEFEDSNTVAAATGKYFKTASKPLDIQVHDKTVANLIGNSTSLVDNTGSEEISPVTDLRLEIELNDTGYYVSYTPITVDQTTREVTHVGDEITNKYYDRNALSQIDTESVYPGLFAARNAVVTFSDIKFETTPYDEATAQPEVPEVEYITPNYSIVSATTSNSADYLMEYEANWHGTLIIRDENGGKLVEEYIKGTPDEAAKAEAAVTLNIGDNTFQATFRPDESYDPYNGDPTTRLESYDVQSETITVTYKRYGAEGNTNALYVAPKGKATGDGTKNNPLDIYTAVKYVQAGQTIYLMGGTYDLANTIRVQRGTDGTESKPIRMIPADTSSRPVFDFHNACEGMVLAGDYWYFYGFDVTRSADGKDGIRVCGDYNTLDSINTYKNGNTGVQISRLLASDTDINTDWPKYNTIKNCTSYLNSDAGYEDADGFACKLTSGEGNRFVGCVAAFNADDGWDLYAKVETGSIGMVTIENCIAYKNGYVLKAGGEGGELAWYGEADDVQEISAGNGNGFKLGGSSLSGYHTLKNSLAFYNKAKGIDSNSCQDIQAYDSISFNNLSFNIAFYTNAATTDYAARNVISYRTGDFATGDLNVEDRIGTKSSTTTSNITISQKGKLSKIFNGTNYFWNTLSKVSELDTNFAEHYTTWTDKDNSPNCTTHENNVSGDWFENIKFDGEGGWFTNLKTESVTDHKAHVVDRYENGTINMGDFLKLTAIASATGAGLPGDLENSEDPTIASPSEFDKVEETDGTIDSGNAAGETNSSIDADDLAQKPGTATDQVGLWCSIVDKDEIGYTGRALKPEVHVYYDNTLLTKKQYSITYRNNVNAWLGDTLTGTPAANSGYESNIKKIPTIIIRGKGNYIGQAANVYFEIQPVNLSNDPQNRVNAPSITKLKANQTVKAVVTFAGRKLSDRKDYTAGELKTETIKEPSTGGETPTEPSADEEGSETTTEPSTGGEGGEITTDPSTGGESGKTTTITYLPVTGKGNFTGTINIEVRDASTVDADHLVKNFKVSKIMPQYRRGYVTDYTGKITQYLAVEPLTESMVKTKSNGNLKLYNPETGEGDFTVKYVNNIEVGTATAIITGMGQYYGTKEVKFRIIAPPLATIYREGNLKYIDTSKLVKSGDGKNYESSTNEITAINSVEFKFETTYEYEGKAISWDNLGMAVKTGDNWYMLTKNTDYTLTYNGNNRAGSASVVAKGKGNYRGSIAQRFKITAYNINTNSKDLLGGTFAYTTGEGGTKTYTHFNGAPSSGDYGTMKNPVYYDKAGAKPAISLRVNGNLMKAGKDYTITYRKNTRIGEATFTIRGRGGLIGTITGKYNIVAKPFDDLENNIQITATDVKLSSKDGSGYKGKNNTRIVVKDARGRALALNRDYEIVGYEYVDNNTYTPTGETIADNRAVVKIDSANSYHTVKVTLKGKGNYAGDADAKLYTYYRITYAKNSLRSARFKINYTGDPKNNPGLANKYFYYKEGGKVTLDETTLKVTLNNNDLTFGKDYEIVSYSKNDRKGTAKVIIQGKGQYVETKVITFRIGAYVFDWWKPATGGDTSGGDTPGGDTPGGDTPTGDDSGNGGNTSSSNL